MSKLDNYFTAFYESEKVQKYLQMQKDRDLFDSMVDSDHIFDQNHRIDKMLRILNLNKHIIKDKTILNIRPKLAILAFAAVREGAKEVIIVDDSNMTNYIEQLILKHNLSDKIKVIKKSVRDQSLKLEKVDILLSDWIGSFGVNMGYAEDFIYARDHFLKANGIVM